ncbi:MAG TPA: hypothetical protein VGQ76_19800 [Thermoanaerobaculia bacterium]|nr:hypothetical protein [Thermoanaerobaculia bacterium]
MRFKYTVVIFLIVVIGAPTTSVTGQEEPLPAIQARGSFEPFTPQIVLASYPIRADLQPSLVDAVRANDYVTFDTLYRANPTPAFATLHELWTYSITDPIGAFYGQEMHDRFARSYPGYTKYIEEFRIVDSNGNVFYPTSETRTFLLDRALDGRSPRVQIADATPRAAATPRTTTPRTTTARETRRESATPARTPSRRNLTPATSSTRTATRSTAAPVTAPVAEKPVVTQRPVVQTPVVQTPPVVAETAPAVETPAVETPTVVRAEPTPAPAPVAEPAVAQPIRPVDNNFGSRGILLLVIGLIGIGLLAMMLRTPREVQPTSIMPPADNTVTPPPVEPIRRPSAAPPPPPPGKNRASGSHG